MTTAQEEHMELNIYSVLRTVDIFAPLEPSKAAIIAAQRLSGNTEPDEETRKFTKAAIEALGAEGFFSYGRYGMDISTAGAAYIKSEREALGLA